MNIAIKEIYVRPRHGEFEVLRPGHRRGLRFATQDLAITHARAIAPLVLVLNRTSLPGCMAEHLRPAIAETRSR